MLCRGRIWRIRRLSALETVLALGEGEKLEEALCAACGREAGAREGTGILCAFAARFLRRGKRSVFENGSMAADGLDMPCLAALCERYRRLYLDEGGRADAGGH